MANRKRTSTQTLKLYTPKPIQRRTRTGCLTCRKRRIKCDEQKPDCFRCQRSKKVCIWESIENKSITKDREGQLEFHDQQDSISSDQNDLSGPSTDKKSTTKMDSLKNLDRSGLFLLDPLQSQSHTQPVPQPMLRPVKSSQNMFQTGGYSIADLITSSNSSYNSPTLDSNDKLSSPSNEYDEQSSQNISSSNSINNSDSNLQSKSRNLNPPTKISVHDLIIG